VETLDFAGMEWSPNGHYLCVWDTPADCSVHIFNVSGQLLQTFAPYDDFLGVKAVRWASNSKILAVSTYDEQVWFLEHLTWKPVWISIHPAKIDIPTLVRKPSLHISILLLFELAFLFFHPKPVFVETELLVEQKVEKFWKPLPPKKIAHCQDPFFTESHNTIPTSFFIKNLDELTYGTVTLPTIPLDEEKPNPPLGVGMMEFSSCGQFFFTRNGQLLSLSLVCLFVCVSTLNAPTLPDAIPTALWIWDISTQTQIALIVQKQPVKIARWQPGTPANSPVLLFCSGNSAIFTWSPRGCGCIDTPFG